MFFPSTLKMFPWIFSDPMQFLSWAPSPWRRGWSLTASRKSCWRGVGKDGVDVGLGNPKGEALSVTKLSVDIMFQVVISKIFGFWPHWGNAPIFHKHIYFSNGLRKKTHLLTAPGLSTKRPRSFMLWQVAFRMAFGGGKWWPFFFWGVYY